MTTRAPLAARKVPGQSSPRMGYEGSNGSSRADIEVGQSLERGGAWARGNGTQLRNLGIFIFGLCFVMMNNLFLDDVQWREKGMTDGHSTTSGSWTRRQYWRVSLSFRDVERYGRAPL